MTAPTIRLIGGTDVAADAVALKWRKVRGEDTWQAYVDPLGYEAFTIKRTGAEWELRHRLSSRPARVPISHGLFSTREAAMAYAPIARARQQAGHVSTAQQRAELVKRLDAMLAMIGGMRELLSEVKALAGRSDRSA
jgi:hypothetical protein